MSDEFARPEFLDRFMTLADGTSPLADLLHRPRLERLGDLMRNGRELPVQTQYFAFGVVFLDQWLRDARSRSKTIGREVGGADPLNAPRGR
jgi:hypothetical protein